MKTENESFLERSVFDTMNLGKEEGYMGSPGLPMTVPQRTDKQLVSRHSVSPPRLPHSLQRTKRQVGLLM